MYILTVIKNIFLILDRRQRTSLILLQVFFLVSAFVQIVGVASIAPFIAIISNPEIIEKNSILYWAYNFFGFETKNQFIVMFAIASIGMIVLSNSISALSFWLLLRYSVSWGSELQAKLFDNFLHREYIFHKTSNYNKSISFVAQETQRFVYMVLQQFLILISQLSVAFVILLGLLLLNPFIALASGALIGGSYLATYIFIRKALSHHGEVITQRNRSIQSLLSEAFIGVKDIKLNALEDRYINTFKKVNHRGLTSMAYISLSGDLPRYVIETISFGAILILATVLLVTSDSIENIISVISIYALAGYKLLPTMQQVYKCISNISANGSIVAELNHEINRPIKKDFHSVPVEPLAEVETIELDDISYQYPKTNELALKNISLTFEKGKLNTIAGPSGSGKSTLADLMLGLLPSSTGNIKVNGEALTETLMPRYQRSIGYVPQNIFILDDTVVANVAFGIEKENIDIARVNEVLKQANAMEFVERLPKGLNTSLGQDGKLLSGGQRQRIGIARALYRNNKVLILDEPTSALDIDSEYELMLLLGRLKAQVLIIVISHRPSAIKLSDMIMLVERGGLAAAGTYEELKRTSDHFREMMEKVFIE